MVLAVEPVVPLMVSWVPDRTGVFEPNRLRPFEVPLPIMTMRPANAGGRQSEPVDSLSRTETGSNVSRDRFESRE